MSTAPLKAVTSIVLALLCGTAQGCNDDTTTNVRYVLAPLADSLAASSTTTGTTATAVVTGVAATDVTSPMVTIINVVQLPPRRPHHPPFRGRRAPGGRVIYVIDGRSAAGGDPTTAAASTADLADLADTEDEAIDDEEAVAQEDVEDEVVEDDVVAEEPTPVTSGSIRALIRPRVHRHRQWMHHRRLRAGIEPASESTN